MKHYFLSLIIIISLSASSQSHLPDNFKIGSSVELFGRDSIKIYFNCAAAVVDKKCASYYRIGKMDSAIINITGDFYDYTVNDKLFLKATMLNNKLEGSAQYFYENGELKEEGIYQNNIRQGKWTFYYRNGNTQMVYNYVNGEPLVLEAYTPGGKATVINGNGSFKTEFRYHKNCNKFETWGDVLNGKKHGKWTFANPNARPLATETYEKGIFIKDESNNHLSNPKIIFTNYYPNEGLDLFDNSVGCPVNGYLTNLKYNKENLYEYFYPQLEKKLLKYTEALNDQWLVVGITINKKNKADAINVASSVNDTKLEKYIYDQLKQMNDWQSEISNSKKVESNIFFTIIVFDNKIIIPVNHVYSNELDQ